MVASELEQSIVYGIIILRELKFLNPEANVIIGIKKNEKIIFHTEIQHKNRLDYIQEKVKVREC